MKKLVFSNGKHTASSFSSIPAGFLSLFPGICKTGLRILIILLLTILPVTLSATLVLPAIPSNTNLAKRFEHSTEMAFRVKVGETYLPSGALIAYINNEIRGAQTASVKFPPTGEMVYKILIFHDKVSGDTIRFKYYDIFSEKVYEITERIEFMADLVPDYANPSILNAFCQPAEKVIGMMPENGKDNLNSTLDLYWQPSQNASYYNLFLWEAGTAEPTTPYLTKIYSATAKVYNLGFSKTYNWKIVSVNDCSAVESIVQTFRIRPLPDLTVSDIQVPASAESGSLVTVHFKVKNLGPGNTFSTQWSDAVYISADASFSGDDKLLNTKPNPRQIAADSTYDQSVGVLLPVEYSGSYYFFVKADNGNALQELSEDNNLVRAEAPVNITLKPLPDILVKDIQAEMVNVTPGDSLLISWKVENTGSVIASGGWNERLTLIPVNGVNLALELTSSYSGDLAPGGTISRSRKYKIPEIARFSGNAKIEVELIPSPLLIEYPGTQANNKAISAGSINLLNRLSLQIQTSQVLENAKEPVRFIISRSGDYSNAMAVEFSAFPSGQVSYPSSIVIARNNSSVVFDVSPVNNEILDGARDIAFTAIAPGYANAVGSLKILDDEVPKLIITLDTTHITEGETALLTVSRDLVTDQPLSVNLSTNKTSQWTFPSSVIIEANMVSAIVTVTASDDQVPELNSQATIYASSAGYSPAQVTATIVDNDIPEVQLTILSDTVSESAGIYATWGVIRRVRGDGNIRVDLHGSPANALFFPATVSLPKGTAETQFNIGVVDNDQVEGYRTVELRGSIFISSCNCGTTAENGGIVSDQLVIADNDGPALTATVDPLSLFEGKTDAGKLTITRNTSVNESLEVTITYSDTSEIEIQASAIIPAGQKSVRVPINTKNDYIEDGDQMVAIQVGAPSFTSGFCHVFVTDQNKPDLSLKLIQLNLDSATAGGSMEISGTLLNTGFLTAPSGVAINFYLSRDDLIDGSDQVLGQYITRNPVSAGDSVEFIKGITLPNSTGNFKIIARANPDNTLTELVYSNNTSQPVPFVLLPEYTAIAMADQDIFLPGTPVLIHGTAYRGSSQPVPNVDVDVYIMNSGTRRELKVRTNETGTFTAVFNPVLNETGHFTIGACYPGQNLKEEQDAFDIPGLQRESSGHIIWDMKLGQVLPGVIKIKNTSQAALHNLRVEPVILPDGCQLTFDTIRILPGLESGQFTFTVEAKELSKGQEYDKVKLKVTSDESATAEIDAYYYCQALQGQIIADPVSINTTITKGTDRLYELSLYNNGAGGTGTVSINLPEVDWMKLVSPATIDNIPSQEKATVILQFSPGTDMPLNTPISGNIAINCVNGIGVSIPYRIEAVSEVTGSLLVDVIDEYTYFTEASPHVSNAHVVVRHPFSGIILAEGFTDSNGLFKVDSLAEGSYTLTVEADKHEGYQNLIMIDPGRLNEQRIFLSFQAITYTWEVVPTEIEDEYEIELVMKFETNVPVPVVIVEMPNEMPQLVGDETFPFLVTLTNKGLITAGDVEITFPTDDAEYEFITTYSKMDLMAQQSIQVPVVMKRKVSPLKSGSADDCTDVVITVYGWECGPDHRWQQSQNSISYMGRECPGGGPPGGGYTPGGSGPSRGGSTSPYYYPFTYTPVGTSSTNCDNCLTDLGLAVMGCIPGPVSTAAAVTSCLRSAADLDVGFWDIFNCAMGFVPGISCLYGLVTTAITCYREPYIFVKKSGGSGMPPILKQSIIDLQYILHRHDAEIDWISEFMGTMDWQSKLSFVDFAGQIDSYTRDKSPIQPGDLLVIQQNMAGSDISPEEIKAFADRWNNTLIAWNLNIYSPNADHPNIIDDSKLREYIQITEDVEQYAFSRGFVSTGEMYTQAMADVMGQIEDGDNSVCASVTIQINQKLVMTREAFEGTLTIFNGNKTTAMEEIELNLEIKDGNGNICNDLFHIETKALDIMTGIDGTGTLGAEEKGSATILFIPEKGAAPEVPVSYSFGGSFSYLDPFTAVTVTKPLFPVTLAVNPSPDLYLHYFMQRDILGDDALTEAIEPVIPAELAVMIENNGYGTAKNVRIESAQPEIIENEKGLAINLALIGSNLNGQPKQLGITNIDFGNIAPKSAAIGQWWYTSDLLGHFVSYDAKVTHLDSRGNPELSLVSGATMHELIRSVRVYGGPDDGIADFLVNEVQDSKEMPDAIYLSNGGVLDVYPASGMSATGAITAPDFEITLMLTPSKTGWNYSGMSDPGQGSFKMVSVTREDGLVLPSNNVWQTHVTLPDGKEPVYENILHFLDDFPSLNPVEYRIRFVPKDSSFPEILRIDSVPASMVAQPVSSVLVVFKNPIDPATFTYEDMTLRVQGGPNLMDTTVTVTEIDPVTYRVDISSRTLADGYYVLTVQTAEITNLTGTYGETGKQVSWTQYAHIPFVEEFVGLPENNAGAPFDFILLRFNLPIDYSTLRPDRFIWKKDGIAEAVQVEITPMDIEGKLFQVSGLLAFLTDDGNYSLTVDLPNITSLEGIDGLFAQTVEWEIDQQPPTIGKILLKKEGGYDQQHVTSIEIQFNESVSGFGLSSIELWKDGLRQPLSQLNLSGISGSEYLFTQFRLLTYYEGNYTLKIRMDGISDISGNAATGTVEHTWIVYRVPPEAVTHLRIAPDLGFSDTDGVTAVRNVSVLMNVNEPGSRVLIYQNIIGSRTLLAEVSNANTGLLTMPVVLANGGNMILEAHCLDSLGNISVTELSLFIDEMALQADWTSPALSSLSAHPDSLLLEFSDKLLDDSTLKDILKLERDGQVLGKENITLGKLSDKRYVLKGFNLESAVAGSYALSVDLTKLHKYNSGKQGESVPKVQWAIIRANSAPAPAILLQPTESELLDITQPIIFNWTDAVDPDDDQVTYTLHIWNNTMDITISGITDTVYNLPAYTLRGHTSYNYTITASDKLAATMSVYGNIITKNSRPPIAAITYPVEGEEPVYNNAKLEITWEPNPLKDADGDGLIAIIRLYGPGIDTTITIEGNPGIIYIPAHRLQAKKPYTLEGKLYDGIEYTDFASIINFIAPPAIGIDSPESLKLKLKVYPNPFSGSATIQYILNAKSRVWLSLCDLSGKELRLLIQQDQPPGEHTVPLESYNYMSGIYVLRLIADSEDGKISVGTCKVIVLK